MSLQTCFTIVAGPLSSWISFVCAVAWIWIHLLQCNVSNQCGGVDEDTLNKPWRPIPAGLISLPAARQLRWKASILSLGLSLVFGTAITWISIIFAIVTWIYNEAHLSSHWFGKSALNTIGYVLFQAGATVIMSRLITNMAKQRTDSIIQVERTTSIRSHCTHSRGRPSSF
jgi:4-hydroxybenzoate polyprenyltransferase